MNNFALLCLYSASSFLRCYRLFMAHGYKLSQCGVFDWVIVDLYFSATFSCTLVCGVW